MKILLAFDGSKPSLNAVRGLIRHVSWFREPLHAHLTFINPAIRDGLVRSFISGEVIEDYYREEGEKALAPACAILEQANLPFTKCISVGPVAEGIVELANANGCELIWMGTHGHGAAAAAALGSVARKVLKLADVPVLLIR